MSPFDVLPAIDIVGGAVASMRGGGPGGVRRFDRDPLDVARVYAEAGAAWIHVVDLDAARRGEPAEPDLVGAIAALGVRVEVGGSLSPGGVRRALAAGAARAILGAGALSDPAALRSAVAEHGERLAVGLDVEGGIPGGVVRPRLGGEAAGGLAAADALALLAEVCPALVVYTDVRRDGALSGPDLEGLRGVAARVGVPVLASGGIRSIEDLRAVATLSPSVVGAIVGRALHEGAFTLREAIDAVRAGPEAAR